MRRSTEVRLYLSSKDGRTIDWFITRVEADGQVRWEADGTHHPGRGTALVAGSLRADLERAGRRAVSDALR